MADVTLSNLIDKFLRQTALTNAERNTFRTYLEAASATQLTSLTGNVTTIENTLSTGTGTGSVVFSNSPTLATPVLGTPASGDLQNCTFPTFNQNTTGNAATATALETGRSINGVIFNGTVNITIESDDIPTTAANRFVTQAEKDQIGVNAADIGNLATVAFSGDYTALSNRPTLGTAAASDTGDFDPAGAADEAQSQVAGIRTISGTTDTLVLADPGKHLRFTNAGAIAVTVPTNASVAIPVNSVITLYQVGAGVIALSGAGVTLNGDTNSGGEGKAISLIKIATDEWDVIGGVA